MRGFTFPLAILLAIAVPLAAEAQSFDLLIRGGRVLDGTGNPAFVADVGIAGGEIVAVGDLAGASAAREIDATGLHVTPGFIDMHSHADRSLFSGGIEIRRASNLVAQGITTVVFGPDGRNPVWPLEAEIAGYENGGTALNVVPMVGHATVRTVAMGDDYERHATPEEIAVMVAEVRQGMEAGAWGLGAGPEYRPGRFSTTEEIIALAHVVADYDGFYYSHQRSQSPLPLWLTPSIVGEYTPPPTWPRGWRLTATDGMGETIRIGRETGIRVVGTHIKAKGPTTWGQSATDVAAINRARAEGIQVYLDQYPYETFGGGSAEVIPAWYYAPLGESRAGGLDDPKWRVIHSELFATYKDNLRRYLDDPQLHREMVADIEYMLDLQGGADRHVIVISPQDESLVGRTLEEVAKANGRTPVEQLIRFALDSEPTLRSGVRFRPLAGSPEDVERYMRQDFTATGTDGGIVPNPAPGQHPRYYGTYPHKIATYVRDKGTITLPFFVRSSTGLPAQIIGLPDRGYIRPGQKADLVAFDYPGVQDHATILDPGGGNEGIEYVFVNGEAVVDEGELTGALPGRVLRRHEVRDR
ncbi:MAG: amidohydrolase family protein [Gammaproteobacteria bacterium]|nr:amidohydrolase family protein [Gammaproteobacteria bacterium]MYF62506.1 amidohydrolase family protein [Gammaproteobacteria bacterium]MYI22347.1 amidohydrolase family protein [Gammaproteobacteria bacterium]